ncbi:MAG: phosphatidylglycerophosphatase A [Kiritimatiellae bacterium]|nr:phosphatidylglycerophosphatase A [Kiritimatiellia bacterium]
MKTFNNNRVLKDKFCLFAATALGLGLAPIAPGTFGTLLGVAAHVAVVKCIAEPHQHTLLLMIFTAVCIAHFMLTPWALARWNDDDPGHFVLDEVAGYLIVPLLVKTGPLWFVVIAGFLLFRFFDIIKVPPARQIDRDMHGAWGILLDDLVSGLYAAGLVYLSIRLFF